MIKTRLLNWKIIEKRTGIKIGQVMDLHVVCDKTGDWLIIEYQE